jgi:hypothetical protein
MEKHSSIFSGRLLGVFFLGCLLFNYPIFSLVNKDILLFGLPLLYVYLFTIWGVLIAFVYWVVRKDAETDSDNLSGNSDNAQN